MTPSQQMAPCHLGAAEAGDVPSKHSRPARRKVSGSLSDLGCALLQRGVLGAGDLGEGDEDHGQLLLVDAAIVVEVTFLQKDRLALLDVLSVVVLTTGVSLSGRSLRLLQDLAVL